MASLTEHAEKVKAAIEAAEADGFKLVIDVDTVYYNGRVEHVDVDLQDGADYVTIWSEDRR